MWPKKQSRFGRSRKRELWAALIVGLLAAFRWLGLFNAEDLSAGSREGLRPGTYVVERVVDGDTLLLRDGRRIRLQGVDTPETVKENSPIEPWGPEATAFTNAFVREAGGALRVEIDGEPRDQHGRFLAFLWNGERMLNEQLVRRGLARATLQYDFSEQKKEVLRRAQRDARRDSVGIWSESN